MKAATGDVLFRLADIATVWVLADVPEYELGSIRIGARATVRVRSQAGTSFEGRSEEHTSELQSLMRISYAVFCLKKKNIKNIAQSDKQTRLTQCTQQQKQ